MSTNTEILGAGTAISPSARWVQLGLGLVCMMAISSPQYVWALFTKPLGTALAVSPAALQVTFSLLIVLQTFFSPLQGWLVDRFGPLPIEVEYLLQVVAIKAMCLAANVERIEVGPKGAVLSFRDNIFANPDGLISFIAKHPEGARVRPDMKVVFFDEWEKPEERLKGATGILRALVGIAAKAKKAA